MQRLTQKDLQGNWNLKGVLWNDLHEGQVITKELWEKLYGALWKLMEYEDTGLSPDEIGSLNEFEGSYAQKYLLELAKHRWIPVGERLPELFLNVLATVYHSEWISDYSSSWVPDEEKLYHPESRGTYLAFVDCDGQWTYLDESNQENTCDEKFCDDKSAVYSVVIAWMPLPDPYKGGENE